MRVNESISFIKASCSFAAKNYKPPFRISRNYCLGFASEIIQDYVNFLSRNCPADCTVTVPGEAGGGALLEVTGYDPATGMLSISFGVPCGATDHTLEYGELTQANLASYNWSNQECGLGMTGTYDWSTAGTPDAMFFFVVANNNIDEGSYGTDSSGMERLADAAPATCSTPQNLQYSCP
jgi:hypothetical protein